MALLEMKSVTKNYPIKTGENKVLRRIDLSIHEGLTAISGDSECAKMALFNIMGGLEAPTSGTVKIKNTLLSILDDEQMAIFRRRNIGYVFKNDNLIPILNVYENISLPLELDNKSADYEYIGQLMLLLNLESKMYSDITDLTDEERQKVIIARSLAAKPSIIVAYEPIDCFDSKTGMDIISLLKMTSREYNQAVVIITNDSNIIDIMDLKITLKDGLVFSISEREVF